ncbi:MAG: hypothetical protein U1B30_03780 [Pseudomonadota bacterium]|nr:hypothetical protein [Pseudomonadota bacterium]
MQQKQTIRHVAVDISSHGYGHAAMTAPLINHLQRLHPKPQITLRSTVPLTFLKSKFNAPFEYLPQSCDIGMMMNSPFEVDRPSTLHGYRQLHGDWQRQIANEKQRLVEIGAEMVISNIAYLPLIAARQLDIPAIAISCLNWADIFGYFFPAEQTIHQQIIAAYQSVSCFIRTEPAMPMADFTTRTVAPLATAGSSRRQQLITILKLEPETRLVLVSMGGIKSEMDTDHWPLLDGVHYITASAVATTTRSDITLLDEIDINYSDALCSCDLLLTKPGYGSFTEAACNGIPVLYVRRDEWPEQPFLTAWLQRQVPCNEITLEQFKKGAFSQPLQRLLQEPITAAAAASGIEAATEIITRYL